MAETVRPILGRGVRRVLSGQAGVDQIPAKPDDTTIRVNLERSVIKHTQPMGAPVRVTCSTVA
ncbi:hypothetical protein [uncultured Roseobacter sp.]|uniref:hypothetical protein n=1 Tax=uncultured Roseobacter sp. TaxID=114847 RepID=UPI00263677E2|nr:hypothetical protein [uncultured Roseobacter sp.]